MTNLTNLTNLNNNNNVIFRYLFNFVSYFKSRLCNTVFILKLKNENKNSSRSTQQLIGSHNAENGLSGFKS